MRLPWKREREQNPWDKEVGLSGWFPGQAGPALDLFALMTSICRMQWDLNDDHLKLLRVMFWQSRIYAVAWIIVMVSSLLGLAAQKGWW